MGAGGAGWTGVGDGAGDGAGVGFEVLGSVEGAKGTGVGTGTGIGTTLTSGGVISLSPKTCPILNFLFVILSTSQTLPET